MAGAPIKRALFAKIEKLGGLEFVCAHIAEGMTIGRLAEFLECSRPVLSFWINQTEERKEAVLRARKLKAEKLVEDALDIADMADETSVGGINKARLQVETRKWMASKLNPDDYGDKSGPLVNISVGDLHLQALKQINRGDVIEQ